MQAGDEAAAALGGGEVAQERSAGFDGGEPLVPDLRGELDGFEGVAGGDGPRLAAERLVGVFPDGFADQAGDGLGGERCEAQRPVSRAAGQRTEGFGVRGQFVGAVGDDEEEREVFGARGEGGEPGEGFGVGPVGVVQDQGDGGALHHEVGEDPVESVAQALGVGRGALFGRAEAEGGADDGVPAAEGLAQFRVGGAGELGLDELAGDVEGLALLLFAAAGREDGAGLGVGAAADFAEERGLAEACGSGEGQQAPPASGPGSVSCSRASSTAVSSVSRSNIVRRLRVRRSVMAGTPQACSGVQRTPAYAPGKPCAANKADLLSGGAALCYSRRVSPVRSVPRGLPGRPRPRRPGRRPRRGGRGGSRR